MPVSWRGSLTYIKDGYARRRVRVPWAYALLATVPEVLKTLILALATGVCLLPAWPRLFAALMLLRLPTLARGVRRRFVIALLDDPVLFPDIPRAPAPVEEEANEPIPLSPRLAATFARDHVRR